MSCRSADHLAKEKEQQEVPEFWSQGFLATRGSFMLDLVAVALVLVLPLLALSIYWARRHRYRSHRRLQLLLGGLLAGTIIVFELDLRLVTDWQARAEPSPYFQPGSWNLTWLCLLVHLSCAVPTAVLWVTVTVQALRHFPQPPVPGAHSARHRQLGYLAVTGMFLTAVTGWLFYWLAFVAQ